MTYFPRLLVNSESGLCQILFSSINPLHAHGIYNCKENRLPTFPWFSLPAINPKIMMECLWKTTSDIVDELEDNDNVDDTLRGGHPTNVRNLALPTWVGAKRVMTHEKESVTHVKSCFKCKYCGWTTRWSTLGRKRRWDFTRMCSNNFISWNV